METAMAVGPQGGWTVRIQFLSTPALISQCESHHVGHQSCASKPGVPHDGTGEWEVVRVQHAIQHIKPHTCSGQQNSMW